MKRIFNHCLSVRFMLYIIIGINISKYFLCKYNSFKSRNFYNARKIYIYPIQFNLKKSKLFHPNGIKYNLKRNLYAFYWLGYWNVIKIKIYTRSIHTTRSTHVYCFKFCLFCIYNDFTCTSHPFYLIKMCFPLSMMHVVSQCAWTIQIWIERKSSYWFYCSMYL